MGRSSAATAPRPAPGNHPARHNRVLLDTGQDVGLARREGGDLTAPRAPHQPLVLLLGHRNGLACQHQRDAVLDPVQPAQPRVVQQRFVGEVQQATLVDWAHQDVKQGVFQGHHCLPWSARKPGTAAGPGPGSSAACRDRVTSTNPATTIAARRRPSLAGLVGRCSWKSQVPAIMKYTLPVTLDTGTTMEARQDCSATWYSSMAATEQPASTYR